MRNYPFSLDIFPFFKRDNCMSCTLRLPQQALPTSNTGWVLGTLGTWQPGNLAGSKFWRRQETSLLPPSRWSIYIPYLIPLYTLTPFIHFFVQVVHHFHSLSFTLYCFSSTLYASIISVRRKQHFPVKTTLI